MSSNKMIIWITGASSGIGEALALEWATGKHTLILSGRNITKLEEVKSACEKSGASCLVVPLDVTVPESIETAAAKVLTDYEGLDILVNNSGISQRSFAIDTPIEVDRKIMETNFFGAVALTKKVLPLMKQQKNGHIVVISSVVGKFGFPLRTAYSASKHALQGFFESLRAEMASDNVRVTIVSPGRIQTNISINSVDKDGNKYGIMDPGQEKGMPVDRCAKKIVNAVRNYKKDILIGRNELLMVYIKKFLPSVYYKLAAKIKPV